MKGFYSVLVFLTICLFLIFPLINTSAQVTPTIEGWVSVITEDSLWIDGKEYPIAKNVRLTLDSERGQEMTLDDITGVGFINKARIHIEKGAVSHIVILEVHQ
jgi:hypothetical protein